MKKTWFFYLLFTCFFYKAKADHITGGEVYYTFGGITNGQYTYRITLKLFFICTTPREFVSPTIISVFNKANGSRVRDLSVPLLRSELISFTTSDPCISKPPLVCYKVGYYEFSVALPPSEHGYIVAAQFVYRVDGINNLVPNYDRVGTTYMAEIPGTVTSENGPENNSARFTASDLILVCADNYFSYSFAAEDTDGDDLRYSFCDAYQGGSFGGGNLSLPPAPPPYKSVPYGQGFTGSIPLGGTVSIDEKTGLITGIAPSPGIYVVTVCVQEIRNGTVIATQRKDLQINISACNIAAATLPPEYLLCKDTRTLNVSNLSNSPLVETYNWEFQNKAGSTLSASANATASYTFPDTGIYKVKLVINRNGECSDSTTSVVKVYPGFIADFDYKGICISKPTQFSDVTTSVYGEPNFWDWDFGDDTNSADISNDTAPSYTYGVMGAKNVRLIAGDTKGCLDTVYKTVEIADKPPINLAFRDTIICIADSLGLKVSGSGDFSWSPDINITNANKPEPVVSPTTTTQYYVDLDDNGCLNRDSVLVRVTDQVQLAAMNDTTICAGDTIQLKVTTDALRFGWTPASQLADPTVQNPLATTHQTTTYSVTASIGGCIAEETVIVSTVPYPVAVTGNDTTICYNTFAQLSAFTNGSSFGWTPAGSLNNPADLDPVASPRETTYYVFSAYDTKGCPKPGTDTTIVTVLPPVKAFAGRDTTVIIGQPLQLNASGGTEYKWSPAVNLSATDIPNPVALFDALPEGGQYKVVVSNEARCVDSSYINIKVFKTPPSVFVPTAFTPNNDGRNDLLRPIAAGIERIEFFRIFNRWGQLVFGTTVDGQGWDGTINGVPQAPGVFVWMVKATDYTGSPYFQKGTVTLIR